MTQIRLAERQGLLTGRGLSRIQFYAVSVLELLDRMKETDEKDRALRTALMVAGRLDPEVAFPELAVVVADDNAELPAEVDLEGNAVATKYDFSNATYDPKAVEEEVKQMLARAAAEEASLGEVSYGDWV